MVVILSRGGDGLTHWGRVMHKCVGTLTIIGWDNGLSPNRRQAIISTNDGLLLIGPLGTNFNEMLIKILTFSFKKMRLKVSSVKWRPFYLGLNVLNDVNMSPVCATSHWRHFCFSVSGNSSVVMADLQVIKLPQILLHQPRFPDSTSGGEKALLTWPIYL